MFLVSSPIGRAAGSGPIEFELFGMSERISPSRRRRALSVLVALLVIACGLLTLQHQGQVKTVLLSTRAWTAQQGMLGVVVFGCIYALAVVFFVPGTTLTPAAAALFGSVVAVPVVSVAGTLGATLAFLIARYGVRDAIAARFANNLRFQWLNDQTARRGALFVVVARLLPVMPGNVIHYAFGLTRVSLGVFVFWSWLGTLPGLIFFVTGSDAVFRLATAQSIPPGLIAVLAAIVTLQVVLVMWAARVAGIKFGGSRRSPKPNSATVECPQIRTTGSGGTSPPSRSHNSVPPTP